MKILVIGEICLDVFVRCKIERLCPEAPVPVLCPIDMKENYGMAGNVVANLKSLDPTVEVTTITPVNTIVKTRYIDSQTGYIVVRVDEKDSITEQIEPEKVRQLLDQYIYDGVLISDYHKGFLTETDIEFIAKLCQKSGTPVFLDTKKKLGEWSRLVTVVKINEKEWKILGMYDPGDCQNLVVTYGSRGAVWINHDYVVPVDPIQVADVSGAGDTYLAAFALEYVGAAGANEDRIKRAMSYANKAARIAVSKRGVVAVRRDEV